MEAIKTLTLVGGISSQSLNKSFFQAIQGLKLEDFYLESFDISKLPFYSQDIEQDPPDSVVEFKDKIREAEAVLFITPEYNRSFPGVLKNAIDWGSRPYGQNLWAKKPAAVTGASPGSIGAFGAQHHLRQTLAYLDMRVLGQPEMYFGSTSKFLDPKGSFTNEKTIEMVKDFFKTFHEFIDLVTEHTLKHSSPVSEQISNENHPGH